MKDHGISLNRHCPCLQPKCPIWGNCVFCIQNHLEHKCHVPECIQNLLRPAVEGLAAQMELKTQDARPDESFWQNLDRDEFEKKSINRHKSSPGESNNK